MVLKNFATWMRKDSGTLNESGEAASEEEVVEPWDTAGECGMAGEDGRVGG